MELTEAWLSCDIHGEDLEGNLFISYPPNDENNRWLGVDPLSVIGSPGNVGEVQVEHVRVNNLSLVLFPKSGELLFVDEAHITVN